MQHFEITKGKTSVILPVSIYDSSSTTGAKLAGLAYNTASLTAYYNRMGASGSATAITLVTATKGTWTSSGFVAIDGTNMPGDYELHIPDAVVASGVDEVLIQLKGAANMVPVNIRISLVAFNRQDSVRMGLTALPNATAGGSAGLPIVGTGTNNFKSDSSANVTFANTSIATVTTLTNLPAITAGWLTATGIAAGALNGKGDWNIGKTGYSLSVAPLDAAGIRSAVGLASANLDTQLGDVPTLTEMTSAFTEIKGATWATTDTLEAIRDRGDAAWITATGFSVPGDAMALTSGERTTLAGVVGTTVQTESYRADGAAGSIAQMLYETVGHLGESSIAGTTKTVKKVDGTTTAATFTLDDASTPTSITRAT